MIRNIYSVFHPGVGGPEDLGLAAGVCGGGEGEEGGPLTCGILTPGSVRIELLYSQLLSGELGNWLVRG